MLDVTWFQMARPGSLRVYVQARCGDRRAGSEDPPARAGAAYDELSAGLTRHVAVDLQRCGQRQPDLFTQQFFGLGDWHHGLRDVRVVGADLDCAVAGGDPDPHPKDRAPVIDGDDLRRSGRVRRSAERPGFPGEQVVTLNPDSVTTLGREAGSPGGLPVQVTVSPRASVGADQRHAFGRRLILREVLITTDGGRHRRSGGDRVHRPTLTTAVLEHDAGVPASRLSCGVPRQPGAASATRIARHPPSPLRLPA